MSFVSYLEKSDREISGAHCILLLLISEKFYDILVNVWPNISYSIINLNMSPTNFTGASHNQCIMK